MITTELYEGQGLGNQLWVYASSRSIAEHLGVGFALQGLERFKGHEFLEIDSLVNVELDDLEQLGDRPIHTYFETMYYDGELEYVSSGFDQSVTQIRSYAKLEGLFQSERYFFGNLERLKQYIRLRPQWTTKVSVPEDTCVLNLRG